MTSPSVPFATPPYNATVHDQTAPVKRELLRIQGAIQPQVTTPVFFSGGANNSPYTVKTTDGLIPCDGTAGAISIVLPAANRAKEGRWTIKKVDSSANAVTITTPSGTIDGASSYTLNIQYETVTVRSDGTNYQVEQFPIGAGLAHTLTFGTHLQAAGTSYNGSANVTIATDATSANTVSTIVARDTSGNFSANSATLAGTITMTAGASTVISSPTAGGLAITVASHEIMNVGVTATNGDMPAGGILSNSSTVTGHRALSIFANDGTSGITVGAYYFTQTAVETVWQYANANGKAQGSTAFQFYPKGGEVSFGQNYAGSSSTKAFIRMYGTTTSNAGGSATLIVQQGGITTDTLAASALISANGGLTVASGQTLTLTGVTVVGLSFTPITGNITYAQLPTGNGTWDTGAGTLITIARSLTVSGTTSTVGFTVSNTASFLNASPFSMSGGGGNVVTVAITLPTAGATVTIPDFAGVNDTFAFMTLAQTLANKTLASSCVVPVATISGTVLTTQGGTGVASYTAGDLPYYATGTAFTKLAIGAANAVLTSSGSAPQWSTNIAYAALPTGSGSWDVGASNTLTLIRKIANLGINLDPTAAIALSVSGTQTGNVNQFGVHSQVAFDSTATSGGVGVYSKLTTAASSFTMVAGIGIEIDTPTIGSGSTVTTVYGLRILSQTGGGTNFAIMTNSGLVQFGDNTRVGGTFTNSSALLVNPSLTASGGLARSIQVNPTLIAAANSDTLTGIYVSPAFTPGSFTGLAVIGLNLNTFSVAAFTSPADPIMLNVGGITGTGATNNYAIRISVPTGATNNYFIAATTVSLFNVTAAGALTLGASCTVATGFGCNGKTAQTAFASGGAAPAGGTGTAAGGWDTAAHRDAAITLLNNIRSALVANGIMS